MTRGRKREEKEEKEEKEERGRKKWIPKPKKPRIEFSCRKTNFHRNKLSSLLIILRAFFPTQWISILLFPFKTEFTSPKICFRRFSVS